MLFTNKNLSTDTWQLQTDSLATMCSLHRTDTSRHTATGPANLRISRTAHKTQIKDPYAFGPTRMATSRISESLRTTRMSGVGLSRAAGFARQKKTTLLPFHFLVQ